MAPPFVTSVTLDVPAGTVENDLMIAAVAITLTDAPTAPYLTLPMIVPPAGWTEVLADYPGGTLDWGDTGDGNAEIRLGVYSKVAGAAEPANYTWDWSGDGNSLPVAGAIQTFGQGTPGVIPSVNEAAAAVRTIAVGVGNPIAVESPSITPTKNDTYLVTFYVARNGLTGTAFALPAAMSDFAPAINLRTLGAPVLPLGLAMFYELIPAAGATGVRVSSCDVFVAAVNPLQGMGYAIAIAGCGGVAPLRGGGGGGLG